MANKEGKSIPFETKTEKRIIIINHFVWEITLPWIVSELLGLSVSARAFCFLIGLLFVSFILFQWSGFKISMYSVSYMYT